MKAANQTGADSANEFAVQTFARMLRDDPDGNWVYSPASLWFVMGMAVIGARGRTLSEMMAAMSLDDIGPLISARAEMLGASSVRMGNMLLCHDGYRLRPEFVEACESRMGAVAWARDFRDPGTVPEVNAWISEMEIACLAYIDEFAKFCKDCAGPWPEFDCGVNLIDFSTGGADNE